MASKYGSTRRFGARYGRGVKLRFGKVEAQQRAAYLCPFCRAMKVRRIAVGIWKCRKCERKFAGRAYTPGSRVGQSRDVVVSFEEEESEEILEESTEVASEEVSDVTADVSSPAEETEHETDNGESETPEVNAGVDENVTLEESKSESILKEEGPEKSET